MAMAYASHIIHTLRHNTMQFGEEMLLMLLKISLYYNYYNSRTLLWRRNRFAITVCIAVSPREGAERSRVGFGLFKIIRN